MSVENATSKRKREGLPATLNKPVSALAIVPLNSSITVTARKAYNVMLHLAQREGDTGDAGYSAPLNAILRGFGVGNNVATDAKRYIDQMTSTKIEWRPLTEGDQWLLPLEGDAAAPPQTDEPRDELRIFHMLAEVRLYKKRGENWVTWFYPPSIKEQMLGPRRWARLELEVIAQLSTYTAVALYEICARYRDNPGGVTSRHSWEWWVAVLKGSEAGKQREWRKFKNEFVNPAVREINDVSDIEVELLEYKQGRAIADVQFAVRKKPVNSLPNRPEPPDVTHLLQAAKLGIRESDVEVLLEQYGPEAMTAALDAMERFMRGATARPIVSKTAYLKTILKGHPVQSVPQTTLPSVSPAVTAAPPPLTTAADDEQARRLAVYRARFESLNADEQGGWATRLRNHLSDHGKVTSAGVMRRLQAGQWQSPLVTAMMIRFYAEQTDGPNWASCDLNVEGPPT
ncbi:MAG: replication initiation protein [Burkholderiales bacterium]|nr:replication initiation protein [Burkholderiales bacterium]